MARPTDRGVGSSRRYIRNDGHLFLRLREGDAQRTWCEIWLSDPFHSFIALPLPVLILVLSMSHLLTWIAFVPIYVAESRSCGLQTGTFLRALYFSLITQTTIGYGTADMTFHGCPWAFLAIAAQTICGLVLNGVLVGALYTKITRAKRRSVRILFSDKAIIRKINDKYFFVFQVLDKSTSATSSDQVVEAHVRCYAIRHLLKERPVYFQQCAMRLSSPNDELGAMLMMALPTQVVHRVDRWSPLAPPDGFFKRGPFQELDDERITDEEELKDNLEELFSSTTTKTTMTTTKTKASGTVAESEEASGAAPQGTGGTGGGGLPGGTTTAPPPPTPPGTPLGGGPPSPLTTASTPSFAKRQKRRKNKKDRDFEEDGPSSEEPLLKGTSFTGSRACYPGLVLREDDCDAGSRALAVCEVCGEAYETMEQLENHLRCAAVDDRVAGHDLRTICPETGEAMTSFAANVSYCAHHGLPRPPAVVDADAQRTHSRRNHLRWLERRDKEAQQKEPLLKRQDTAAANNGNASTIEMPQQQATTNGPVPHGGSLGGARSYEPPEYAPSRRRMVMTENDSAARDAKEPDDGRPARHRRHDNWYEESRLRDYLEASDLEVLVVVEGIEPYTSSTLMARHSYNYKAGDIQLNAAFPPCVDLGEDGAAVINIDAFNQTEDAPPVDDTFITTPSIV